LHSLSNSETEQQPVAEKSDIAIGVGPVEFPDYLNRPQIVTRTSPNQLELAEFDRWAEPLRANFSRVLAENLSILLSTDRVVIFPWKKPIPINYQIEVDVSRFDGMFGRNVTLKTRWTLFGNSGKKVMLVRKSTLSEQTLTSDYKEMVAAQSRVLASLSREIAASIKEISQSVSTQ
jgi:uncharacterized lipoprotein YmbA